jgi:hypothetical protein
MWTSIGLLVGVCCATSLGFLAGAAFSHLMAREAVAAWESLAMAVQDFLDKKYAARQFHEADLESLKDAMSLLRRLDIAPASAARGNHRLMTRASHGED